MPAAAGQSPLQAKSYNEAVRGKRAGAAAVPALPSRWQQRQTHACVFRALDRRGRTDEWEAQPLIPPGSQQKPVLAEECQGKQSSLSYRSISCFVLSKAAT